MNVAWESDIAQPPT